MKLRPGGKGGGTSVWWRQGRGRVAAPRPGASFLGPQFAFQCSCNAINTARRTLGGMKLPLYRRKHPRPQALCKVSTARYCRL